MTYRAISIWLATAGISAALASGAASEEFRWGGQGDPSSMDPHAAAVGTNLSFLGNIYDGHPAVITWLSWPNGDIDGQVTAIAPTDNKI